MRDIRKDLKDISKDVGITDIGFHRALPGMIHSFDLMPKRRWFEDDFFLGTSRMRPLALEHKSK
jgi:hypothetical protein